MSAENDGWEISHILLTHAHFDHVGGLQETKTLTGAPIYIHQDAVDMLSNTTMSAAFFGLRVPAPPQPDHLLTPGQIISVGNLKMHVLFTPGHAPGHVCFHLPEYRVLFDGDLLFRGGIGRTDLTGGDHDQLLESIRSELLILPEETRVFSGHGPATTIGVEMASNPFLEDLAP
jgi:hydroxyacylglutathione hydrolase